MEPKDTGTDKHGNVLALYSRDDIKRIGELNAAIERLNTQIIEQIEATATAIGLPCEYDDRGFPSFTITERANPDGGSFAVSRDGLITEDYADGWIGAESDKVLGEWIADFQENPPAKWYDVCRDCGTPQGKHTPECPYQKRLAKQQAAKAKRAKMSPEDAFLSIVMAEMGEVPDGDEQEA